MQVNYRPFDESAFKFLGDGNENFSSDAIQLAFADQTSAFWFAVANADGTYDIKRPAEVKTMSGTAACHFIVQSL